LDAYLSLGKERPEGFEGEGRIANFATTKKRRNERTEIYE